MVTGDGNSPVDWSCISVRSTSVSDTLSARLQQMIADRDIRPSQKLPPERELAALLGVSRASVREAIHELVLKGLVDRRPGRGTIVVDSDGQVAAAGLLGIMDGPSRELLQVLDFRETIEPPIAALAASRATAADKARLQDSVHSMDDSITCERSLQLDLAFHRKVAQAGHNPLLVKLVDVTFEWIEPGRERAHTTMRGRRISTEGHRDILAAIVRGSPDAAAEAMLRHIGSIGAVTRQLTADEGTP